MIYARTIGLVLMFLFGALCSLYNRPLARQAVRQAESITGEKPDERPYILAFKYGGITFVVVALLRLTNAIP